MFHLKPKPSPPRYVGRETPGHAVDSSAAVITPGSRAVHELVQLLAGTRSASRSSLPPNSFGTHSPCLARVVEVEHRGDGVDAQAVGVELAQPVERVREQEVAHLVAAEVEDERAPVGVRAAARVGVLVERRAVEAARAPSRRAGSAPAPSRGSRRCRAGAARSTKARKSSGVPKRDVRREVARHLVAPRAAERVLHDRQQLDVREAHVARRSRRARRRARGTRAVAGCLERRAATSRGAPRRSRSARVSGSRRAARSHPLVVLPLVRASGRRSTPSAAAAPAWNANGSAFRRSCAVCVADLELVARPVLDVRDEQLPDAGRAERRASGAGGRPSC